MTELEAITYIKVNQLPITHIFMQGRDETWLDLWGYKLIIFYPLKIENTEDVNSYGYKLSLDFGVIIDSLLDILCKEHNLDFDMMKGVIGCIIGAEQNKNKEIFNNYKEICNERLLNKGAKYETNKTDTCSCIGGQGGKFRWHI